MKHKDGKPISPNGDKSPRLFLWQYCLLHYVGFRFTLVESFVLRKTESRLGMSRKQSRLPRIQRLLRFRSNLLTSLNAAATIKTTLHAQIQRYTLNAYLIIVTASRQCYKAIWYQVAILMANIHCYRGGKSTVLIGWLSWNATALQFWEEGILNTPSWWV